jgi:hypothetical protein
MLCPIRPTTVPVIEMESMPFDYCVSRRRMGLKLEKIARVHSVFQEAPTNLLHCNNRLIPGS